MCMSKGASMLTGGLAGGSAIRSKKVQGLVQKNFDNTIGGAIMKNNINKSPPSRSQKTPTPVKSTAPSPLRIRGRTGLNINS